MITTATHTISARYSIENGITHEITKNGYTIEEIITEMLEFANWMPGIAAAFEVTSETRIGDNFRVTIEGDLYCTDEDGDETDETDRMIIVIEAWEK